MGYLAHVMSLDHKSKKVGVRIAKNSPHLRSKRFFAAEEAPDSELEGVRFRIKETRLIDRRPMKLAAFAHCCWITYLTI